MCIVVEVNEYPEKIAKRRKEEGWNEEGRKGGREGGREEERKEGGMYVGRGTVLFHDKMS